MIEVPAIAGVVWALARLGIGNPEVPALSVLRLTAAFAGLAALVIAGGTGRLAAATAPIGGRARAVFVAARAHAVASPALVLIAAIPHGQLPAVGAAWLAYLGGGIVAGAACGAVIGVVCSGAAPVDIGDVWSLARRPSEALLG